jgi:RNA polymerase sigma-70 factor (ECF subfamily)
MSEVNQYQPCQTGALQLAAMISQAKIASERSRVGPLLDLYRNYLSLIAQGQINTRLRIRVEASDVVQETFLDAHRDFPNFRGTTEAELIAWLRKTLARNILDQAKMHGARRRDYHRDQSIEAAIDRSSMNLAQAFDAGMSTPSVQAARREQAVLVADAIANLPAQYRKVIMMRQIDRIPFSEIG